VEIEGKVLNFNAFVDCRKTKDSATEQDGAIFIRVALIIIINSWMRTAWQYKKYNFF